jgi:hypothetical protein
MPTTCSACEELKAAETRQVHLNALADLPLEERIRKLEEYRYDHSRQYHPRRPVRF